MAYVHFLAAWQHQDLEQIKAFIYEDVKMIIVRPDGTTKALDYDEIVSVFKERFSHDHDWAFDVIYKTERDNESLVVIKVSHEDAEQNAIEKSSLCLFTFAAVDGKRQLIRAYMETGLTTETRGD